MNTNIRFIWLILLAALLQVISVHLVGPTPYLWLVKTIIVLSYLILIFALVFNRHWWCFRIILLGAVMNFLVIVCNGGLMPVSPEAIKAAGMEEKFSTVQVGQLLPGSKDILLNRSDTRLQFLSDIFTIKYPTRRLFSPGDAIVVAGIPVFMIELIARIRTSKKRSA